MEKNKFFVYSLLVFFMLGVLSKWNAGIKIVVILNSLLVLVQVAHRLLQIEK